MAANTTPGAMDDANAQISLAAKLIENNIQADSKFPAITDLLHASSSGDYEAAIPSDWQVVTKQRLVALPDALFEQYDLLECRCFMGLFPEIKRAWITVDHRLFLWNYEDESDFYSFEDQEQIIVSVALVKPKPGVFVDTIEHVLVIATPLEVFLLGVGYSASKVAGARGGEVTLYATQISVPADGVAMTSIVGTADGRVFMSGNDGGLYEFVYQSSDGWLTRKARKVNLTLSIASYFVPTFLGAKRETPALSMAVDNDRRLLYVLLQDASIKVFWLGAQGDEFVLAHHHKSIANAAALLCPQFNEGADPAIGAFQIASMHVIPPSESRSLSLVAISGGGCRLYFSGVRRMQRLYESTANVAGIVAQPEVFELVHVRLPPETQPTLNKALQGRAPRALLNVHTAFYCNGTTLLAHTWNEDHDSIVGCAPASAQMLARMARQPRATLAELAATARVEGRTWAIAEIDAARADGRGLNDLVTVAGRPTRQFAVLTNAGVSILEKQRPADMFRALVAKPAVQDAQLADFVSVYGLDETCAMCFIVLCADEFAFQGQGMQVLNAARRILFEYGGVPRLVEDNASVVGAASSERIVLSGRHNGLAIYLARTLQPIWSQMATVMRADRLGAMKLNIGISVPQLVSVQDRLRRLQQFINNNQRFVPDQINQMPMQASGSSARSAADVTSCWQAEARSLGALYDLIVGSIEVISFLCLMSDFNLPAIADTLSEQQRQRMTDLPFNQLVCSDAGRQACRDMILALVNSRLKQHASIDSISDVLTRRCSTMFAATDVTLYKALEALKLARETEEGNQASDYSAEALRLLLSIAGSLTAEQLQEICSSFEALGQFAAIGSLSLACANQSDPHDDALAYWREGVPVNDAREAIYLKRLACYHCVLDALDKNRRQLLNGPALSKLLRQAAPPQGDALFEFALFDWLLENNEAPLLFQLRSPFVEQYLMLEPRTLEKCDMLWHFYIHESMFAQAAIVQRQIAFAGDLGLPLARKIEYLSLSTSNAKIALDVVRGARQQNRLAGAPSEEEEEVNELARVLRENEDFLDVAQVQLEIQQQLRHMGGHDTVADTLDHTLFNVTELYNRFAEPLNLLDAQLLIYKASNLDSPEAVLHIWRTLLRTILDDQARTGLMAVATKVVQLGACLYPSPAAFPISGVAAILADFANERPAEYQPGYISDTLLRATVPRWAVFEALNALYVRSAPGADEANVQLADTMAREVAAMANSWVDMICGGAPRVEDMDKEGLDDEANGMPTVAVDDALSQYIINATLSNNALLKEYLQRAQERIRQQL
ncbi:hypothetical protein GGI07_001488 [Coemansia sp. Benny D115]|nr:hypothetical protein GGI07_001488 [Coemansia sp. Benny D115]